MNEQNSRTLPMFRF